MRTGCIISDKSIKVVKIKGNKPLLLRVPLEAGIVTDGVIIDAAKLKIALGKLSLAKEEVVVGLLEKHILGKSLTISDHGSDLEARITEELSSYVPAGQSYTDWQVLETGVDYQKIFVASVSASLLDSYVSIFEALSIPVAGVEPITFALSRHLPKTTPSDKNPTPQTASVVVALEESEILLSIINEKGGVELTSVLPQAASQNEDLLSEISNMRSFYDKKTKGAKAGRVLLTGEGATAELKARVDQTGVACNFLRIENRSIGEKEAFGFFSVFALCDLPVAFPKNHEHINLLPAETLVSQQNKHKSKSRADILRSATISLGVLCFLYLAIIGFLFWQQVSNGGEITKIRNAIKGGNSSKVRSEVSQINKYIAIAKKVSQKDPTYAFTTLSFLQEKSGNGITITSYTFDLAANTVVLGGQSVERDRLIGFGQILETEGKFTNVKIPLTSLEKKGASTFSLSFEVPKQ